MIYPQLKTPKSILLFDMDGVLLKADGYHRALQESVALVGKALGYRDVWLSQEDINLFEAVGITSEWDSAAICSLLLLIQLWENGLDVGLPANPVIDILPQHRFPCPDFQSFCRTFARQSNQDSSPLLRAERLLVEKEASYTPGQMSLLLSVLHQARAIQKSLTHRIFQEMVLGSQIFKATYTLPPFMDVDSYLKHYDHPTLTSSHLASLRTWLRVENHSGAIFTNRPSRPPNGFFSTPEAEIGAQTVGLENLPIVGFGALSWFAFENGLDLQAFLKPSPIHVLAALWLALQAGQAANALGVKEGNLIKALEVAIQASEGRGRENWIELEGAQVFVFEDAVRGMKSAHAAQEVLAKMNIHIRVDLCGITDSGPKQEALSEVGAVVFPNLSTALSTLGVIP